jgi:NADH-quinone oxidoreductase subunit D
MITRIGGLVSDIPTDTVIEARDIASLSRDAAARVTIPDQWDRLAILSPDAASTGASGPVGWASGVTDDLRRDVPYLAYRGLDIPRVTGTGSAADRYRMLITQIQLSTQVIDFCLRECADSVGSPVNVPLPKTLRVPESITYVATENPFGHHGVLLVSSGDTMPWRMKFRTPSFAHVQLLSHALPGTALSDLGDAVASFFLISGDIDR